MAKKYLKRSNDLRQTLVRMPADLYAQLAEEAERAGISMNAYIVRLIVQGRMQESGSGRSLLQTAG